MDESFEPKSLPEQGRKIVILQEAYKGNELTA